MNRDLKIAIENTTDKAKNKEIKQRGTTKRQFNALFGFNKEAQSECSSYGKEIEQLDPIEGQLKNLHDAQIEIWNGSLDEQKVIDLMKMEKVVSREILRSGITRPEKITLESGIVGVFKRANNDHSARGRYNAEIAAYEIDKLLELRMVPLTIEREIANEKGSFEKGSFQLWVDNLITPTKPSGKLPDDIRFFDLLISNPDRLYDCNCGLLSKKPKKYVLYDNARAFYLPNQDEMPLWPQRLPLPSPSILEKAQQINMEMLNQIQSLPPEQKQSFLERRDVLIKAIEDQSRSKGCRSLLSKCWS